MVQTIIFNQSNIETVQPVIGCKEAVSGKVRNPRRLLTIPRIYRKELRMARALARFIDAHPTISNICLWLMGLAFMVEIFLYA
jgi:hypothetical protein